MTAGERGNNPAARRRLAIIGAGSSGLICLKLSLELLPGWDVECFEESGRITGCWGNPYPGFCSTSSKYTTQFACFPLYNATVNPDRGASREEFFRDGEYGAYLEQFAEHFGLRPHIRLGCRVERVNRGADGSGWEVTIRTSARGESAATTVHYDAVVVCTGLAAEAKPVNSPIPVLSAADLNKSDGLAHIIDRRVVVIGGGESAVDYAYRLSRPEFRNTVFLSLQSGIRVSPRYHPIRGVPSDFLRNRLMLSIHEDLRNWIGQRFVELRIRYQEIFERLFPGSRAEAGENPGESKREESAEAANRSREWAYKLTKAAKDELFNMFHNKSDDFLGAVGRRELTIVGPPTDDGCGRYRDFDSNQELKLSPDLLVPAIGYRSTLETLSAGRFRACDFYLGCCHVEFSDLYLVGFARPIIGNIPTISEMQAEFVCGLIAGTFQRPQQIRERQDADMIVARKRYSKLNLADLYPVEMIPYCDRLAGSMNCYPSLHAVGSLTAWCRMQLSPATTMHYWYADQAIRHRFESAPIYLPTSLVVLLLMLKPLDRLYRFWRFLVRGAGIWCRS